jgi:hypothetical protein
MGADVNDLGKHTVSNVVTNCMNAEVTEPQLRRLLTRGHHAHRDVRQIKFPYMKLQMNFIVLPTERR